jgi:hypothetical protein
MTLGKQVLPEFRVVQHNRDIALLHNLKTYFQCGVIRKNRGDRMVFRVRGHKNLLTKIIPFFEKHKLKSKKRVDFEKFRKIVFLLEKKTHLTPEGLQKIQQIAATINTQQIQLEENSMKPKIESSFN